MTTYLYQIFSNSEDYWDWEKHLQQCDLIELSEPDRQSAKEAIRYLRRILGEGFLRRADKERNPIFYWYFSDSSAQARLSLTRFANALRALEESTNFKAILRRIKRPRSLEEFKEGRSVIEVACKFSEAGFATEFEPTVKVINHRGRAGIKKPDFKIRSDAGEEIFVEVSRLRASADEDLIDRTYHVIWDLLHNAMWLDPEAIKDILHPRFVLPYGLIHRGIEDEELKGIVNKINKLIEHVRATGKFSELIIEDTIEVCVAPYDDHDHAKRWGASRGMTDLVQGPDISADEITRARVKLRDKLRQLPDDKPGIIVMPASENLIFFVYDIRAIVAGLAEEVKKHSKLLCAIMFHTFDDGANEDESFIIDIAEHTFSRQIRSDGTTEQLLIIRNDACEQAVSPEMLIKVERVFAIR